MPRSRLFRPANELLASYASYHRDRRNIITHLVGIPMIVLSVGMLLGLGGVAVAGLWLSWAWLACAAAALWYLTRGHLGLGAATAAGVVLLVWAAHQVDRHVGAGQGLLWGLSLFVLGWIIQFVGHYYEGRKPAFADDLTGLLVGPMFVVFELLASVGLCKALAAEIERRAGPTYLRDLAHPAT